MPGLESLCDAFGVSKDALSTRLRELGLVRINGPVGSRRTPRLQPTTLSAASASDVEAAPLAPSVAFEGKPASHSVRVSSTTLTRTEETTKSVALLGNIWDHWKNRRLLKERGWAVRDDDFVNAVEHLRADPPCGIVVHSSFWQGLPPARQEEALRALAELSSFIFVRLDFSGVAKLASGTCAKLLTPFVAERPVGAFRQAFDSHLDDADMLALEQVFEVRSKTADVVLQSDTSLDCSAISLLKLIVAERFVARATPSSIVVIVRQLPRGNSGAHTYVLSPDDNTQPLFLKMGNVRSLSAELEHTLVCQPYLASIVVPNLRFHGSLGALVQPFISADGTSTVRAPSLEEFLHGSGESSSEAQFFLESVLPRVLDMFTRLGGARTRATIRHLDSIFRTYTSDRSEGSDWGVGPLPSGAIDDLARRAIDMLTNYEQVGMVHGDAHLRNILLRCSAEPVLVDFAHGGPGHPLFDFVRFELGVWRALLKNSDPKAAQALVAQLLARETIDIELAEKFKDEGLTVEVALKSSMLVRESCQAVIDGDKSWFGQYRSMHALLALLALRSPGDHYLSFAVFSAVAPCAQLLAV
jgi:hypothetical protein